MIKKINLSNLLKQNKISLFSLIMLFLVLFFLGVYYTKRPVPDTRSKAADLKDNDFTSVLETTPGESGEFEDDLYKKLKAVVINTLEKEVWSKETIETVAAPGLNTRQKEILDILPRAYPGDNKRIEITDAKENQRQREIIREMSDKTIRWIDAGWTHYYLRDSMIGLSTDQEHLYIVTPLEPDRFYYDRLDTNVYRYILPTEFWDIQGGRIATVHFPGEEAVGSDDYYQSRYYRGCHLLAVDFPTALPTGAKITIRARLVSPKYFVPSLADESIANVPRWGMYSGGSDEVGRQIVDEQKKIIKALENGYNYSQIWERVTMSRKLHIVTKTKLTTIGKDHITNYKVMPSEYEANTRIIIIRPDGLYVTNSMWNTPMQMIGTDWPKGKF